MSVLRVYDPNECDEDGVPFDWKKCRKCEGTGEMIKRGQSAHEFVMTNGRQTEQCVRCAGHGSLKAWVLALKVQAQVAAEGVRVQAADGSAAAEAWMHAQPARCEDCCHPMSDGTWERENLRLPPATWGRLHLSFDDPDDATDEQWAQNHRDAAWSWIRHGEEPPDYAKVAVHWSPCDERCTHGPPFTVTGAVHPHGPSVSFDWQTDAGANVRAGGEVSASWRQVDVRTLGWAHDLRPEKLAVLCLRCWAARK